MYNGVESVSKQAYVIPRDRWSSFHIDILTSLEHLSSSHLELGPLPPRLCPRSCFVQGLEFCLYGIWLVRWFIYIGTAHTNIYYVPNRTHKGNNKITRPTSQWRKAIFMNKRWETQKRKNSLMKGMCDHVPRDSDHLSPVLMTSFRQIHYVKVKSQPIYMYMHRTFIISMTPTQLSLKPRCALYPRQ